MQQRQRDEQRRKLWVGAIAAGALVLLATGLVSFAPASRASSAATPQFDAAFSAHWSDGKAELAGYRLQTPRYGEQRQGTAVLVFVKEDMAESTRVKPDRPGNDSFPVMKLNLVEDFTTGIYDYNLMTSTFVQLREAAGRGPGELAKVSFSSQEWCGHAYEQLLIDPKRARQARHSYFDGEADRIGVVAWEAGGLDEDALFHWARGMAAPAVEPGATRTVRVLRSLRESRLLHKPLEWLDARLERSSKPERLEVPAGAFDVERKTVAIEGGLTWTFFVERAFPHRLVAWRRSDGTRAELTGSTRLPYWELHDNRHEELRAKLGL